MEWSKQKIKAMKKQKISDDIIHRYEKCIIAIYITI